MHPQLVFVRLLRESDIHSGVSLMGSQGTESSTCRAYLSRARIEFHINSYQEEKLSCTPYVADMLCAAQCRPSRPQQIAACPLHRLEKHNFLYFVCYRHAAHAKDGRLLPSAPDNTKWSSHCKGKGADRMHTCTSMDNLHGRRHSCGLVNTDT